jgi:hypothetical protein
MLHGYNGWRGWLVIVALVPLVFVATYEMQPEVRRAAFWGDDWRDRPLAERIHILPAEAVASLRDELSDGAAESTLAPAGDADYMLQDLRAAVARFPDIVHRMVAGRLIGVFLVENLGDGEQNHNLGMALEVAGLWRQHAGTIILIDRNETDMRANRAMSGMEYVPHRDYGGVSVEARLARRGEDDRTTTLSYVLLHELGHLIDYERGITPGRFRYGEERAGCGFTCISWVRRGQHRHSRRIDMALRSIEAGQYEAYMQALPETFEALAESDFPSLYATTLPEEDFAESFAQYVHTVMMDRPWELILRVDGTIKGRLQSCFVDRRCPEKKAYFDALLAEDDR